MIWYYILLVKTHFSIVDKVKEGVWIILGEEKDKEVTIHMDLLDQVTPITLFTTLIVET